MSVSYCQPSNQLLLELTVPCSAINWTSNQFFWSKHNELNQAYQVSLQFDYHHHLELMHNNSVLMRLFFFWSSVRWNKIYQHFLPRTTGWACKSRAAPQIWEKNNVMQQILNQRDIRVICVVISTWYIWRLIKTWIKIRLTRRKQTLLNEWT